MARRGNQGRGTVLLSINYWYQFQAYTKHEGPPTQPTLVALTFLAPTNLAATPASPSQIDLTWSDNSTGESGYQIEVWNAGLNQYVLVATPGPNVTTYSHTGLAPQTQHYYRVRAINQYGTSAYSVDVLATTPALPPNLGIPTNVAASVMIATSINVTWTPTGTDWNRFYIRRGIDPNNLTDLGWSSNTVYVDSTNLTPGTRYYYCVQEALYTGPPAEQVQKGACSTTVSAIAGLVAPTGLGLSPISSTQINLAWTDNSSGETGYKIELFNWTSSQYQQIATVGPNVTAFSHTGLAPGVQYRYRVRAYTGADNSPYSNEVGTTVALNAPGVITAHTFTGVAGQKISIAAQSPHGADVLVKKPDGTALYPERWVWTYSFFDTIVLPISGTYTIEMDPRGVNVNMTFTIFDVPPDLTGSITPGGDDVPLSTTTPGQNGTLTFSGVAGQKISAVAQSTNGAHVLISKPDGTALYPNRWVWVSSFFDTIILPVTGTYTILMDPQGAGVMSMSFTVYDVPADVTGSITIGGSEIALSTTAPGQNGTLSFSGVAGQKISVVAQSTNGANVLLKKPDGTALYPLRWVWGYSYFETITLPESGTYTILMDPQGSSVVTMSFTVYDVPADVTGAITIGGGGVPLSNTTPGQNGTLTFSGVAGQQISITAQSSTGADVLVSKPDGTPLYANRWVWGSWQSSVVTLPASGTYTILMNPQQAAVVTMTFTVNSVP
jgi:hypothetical protein